MATQLRLGNSSVSLIVLLIASVLLATGCGSGNMASSAPKFSGTTSVTMLLSSTANDELSQFNVGFSAISLTSQSGKTVSLYTNTSAEPPYSEFIHLNSGARPLLTTTVPQDVYTAATVSIGGNYGFACVSQLPSGGYKQVSSPQRSRRR